MSASPERAASRYRKSKHRLSNCQRERTMTVDLGPCIIRVSHHRFHFRVKNWDKNEASPRVTAPYSVADISSFLTSADSRVPRDHAHYLHDDIEYRDSLHRTPLDESNLSC
jgi:hypothetical protein